MISLVEELKCAKTSLETTLPQSKDPAVKKTAPMVKTGREWNTEWERRVWANCNK